MSLTDLAALGSFVSGLAVLVSLVFLYFQLRQVATQVRQAEANQRALMNQGYVTRTIDLLKFHTEPRMAELRSRIFAGKTDFTSAEVDQLTIAIRCALLNLQDAFVQHRSGLIDNIVLDNSLRALKSILSQPTYRALWVMTRASYASDLIDFVDGMIADLPLAKPVDSAAQLQAALVQIMS